VSLDDFENFSWDVFLSAALTLLMGDSFLFAVFFRSFLALLEFLFGGGTFACGRGYGA